MTPAQRGKGNKASMADATDGPTPAERRVAMTWAQRMKRVFNIDIDKSAGQPTCIVADCREAGGHRDVPDETCKTCGGDVKIIVCIEDPVVIEDILTHLKRKDASGAVRRLPPCRAPPQASLFD